MEQGIIHIGDISLAKDEFSQFRAYRQVTGRDKRVVEIYGFQSG